MSEQQSNLNDGINDAIAATAIIALVVVTVTYWLSGMPS
ncbi:methionine synthase [Oceanicoccus sp. KOV_DT_Chl]|nr:methionine synthase [Oceanicoccus sp. KOV_DT_Chl]